MDPPAGHSHSSSSYNSFPILAISILGILTTAILLLSYYLFVVKCCLHWRRTDVLLPFRSHRIRRRIDSMRLQYPQSIESRGLDSAAIRSIPTLRFSKTCSVSTTVVECAVCLSEFEDHELLRLLPGCKHSFHIDCIDTWLQTSANCPLCRFDISRVPINLFPYLQEQDSSLVIEVAESNNNVSETPIRTTPKTSKSRRFWHVASMGDECIDISRAKDERFTVQPIRRSFSMDSSNDRSLFLAVQEILQQNRNLRIETSCGEGSSNGGCGSGRIRRSFFSFGRSTRSTSAVLPVQSELC